MNSARAAYQLTFELSPIILTGGIASFIPGGMLPLISITQSIDFVAGLLSQGSGDLRLDDFFCHFQPVPGGTLFRQEVGHYPFANQAVAANATIVQPKTIS